MWGPDGGAGRQAAQAQTDAFGERLTPGSGPTKIVIRLSGGQPVPDGADHRMLGGDDRFAVSAAGTEPFEPGGQERVTYPGPGLRRAPVCRIGYLGEQPGMPSPGGF